MDIYFTNTLTHKKDKFVPIDDKEVRIYSCGPTVYKDATIGNMRTNIFQDVLRRVLKYNGYKIKHVMNITDVGHLVSDGDEGEDKMLKSAREENKTPLEIAKYYTKLFFDDLEALNIETPEVVCKATDHIEEMLEYVRQLVKNGYEYEGNFEGNKLGDMDRPSTIISYVVKDIMEFTGLIKSDDKKKKGFGVFVKKDKGQEENDESFNGLKSKILIVCELIEEEILKCENKCKKIEEIISKYYQ